MNWILILAILACPLMHLWMMRKGKGCGHDKHQKNKDDQKGGEEE